MGPQHEVQRTPGQTDAQGGFRFEPLATGPEYTYYIGIRYDEQLYRSDPVVLEPGQQVSGVVIALAEPAGEDCIPQCVPVVHIGNTGDWDPTAVRAALALNSLPVGSVRARLWKVWDLIRSGSLSPAKLITESGA